MHFGRFCGNLGAAERAFGGLVCIRWRLGQRIGGDFLFMDPAESEATGTSGDRICSDLNGPLHNLSGGINEFGRYGLTLKLHLRMF